MKEIKNLSIWKETEEKNNTKDEYFNTDIGELNLSVRSYNCLKRAGCGTVRDILNCMGEDGQGLRKIRNLGNRSETEILVKLEEYKEICAAYKIPGTKNTENKKLTIIKPAKSMWDREIDEFHLSNYARNKLKSCGIQKVKDLYATNPKMEPGWYAVRELFEKIPSCR